MTYAELIRETQRKFQTSGIHCGDIATHSVDFLLQVTELTREKLLLSEMEPVDPSHLGKLENAERRRIQGEPLQYIVGYAWFWNSKFKVGPGVLIPRKETEHIVEYLMTLPTSKSYKVAELGAGSGNIGVSALQERGDWQWFGFELNYESFPYLRANVRELLAVDANYQIIEGDFFSNAPAYGPFDLVVSNPPYVSVHDESTLSREVRREPRLALYSGESGLEHIEKLITQSLILLNEGGVFISEIGSDQGAAVRALANRHGLTDVNVIKDIAGLDRILIARKNGM